MTARLVALCIGANDPPRLARFWATALGWELDDEAGDDTIGLRPTDGTTFGIVLRPVAAPKTGRNRIHFDLTSTSIDDQRASVSTLLELGARHLDIGQGPDALHVVLADPEGNELCIIEPQNSFLASCGRLGALSCDGSRAVGCFWSEALGWPLVWDQGEETAIRAPDGTGPFITWGGGPDLPKVGRNRLYLEVAPHDGGDHRAEVDRLASLGAVRLGSGEDSVDAVLMSDPDGNELRVSTLG